jgi:hypothetical protein
MPKSKRSLKRRKKVKNKPKYNQIHTEDNGYMKTDGQSRVCKYDKNHNFLGYATEEEAENF